VRVTNVVVTGSTIDFVTIGGHSVGPRRPRHASAGPVMGGDAP
jgi:hypothetical protein